MFNSTKGRLLLLLITLGLIGTGCQSVPVREQYRLAQLSMQDNGRLAFQDTNPLSIQAEPGAADSGGGVASGCSSCR